MPFLVMVVTVKVKWELMIEHSVTELLEQRLTTTLTNSPWSLTPNFAWSHDPSADMDHHH